MMSVFVLGNAFSHSTCFPLMITILGSSWLPCESVPQHLALDCRLHPELKYFNLLSSSNTLTYVLSEPVSRLKGQCFKTHL